MPLADPALRDEPIGFLTRPPVPAPRPPAWGAAWLGFGLSLSLYLATMNRTIGFVDRGELAAAACTFGIPHSPGYPTLMMAGGALARLLPVRPVLALNAFAALLVAASVAALVLVLDRVLARVAPADLGDRARAHYALLGAVFVSVTLTWWQQANGFGVHALHALVLPLVTLLFLRWIETHEAIPPAHAPEAADALPHEAEAADLHRRSAGRRGFAFALVLGLSFTNHLTTILLLPALLAFAISRLGGVARVVRAARPLILPFLLGLTPYLWLPLRSRMGPRFDWGGTDSWRGFLHHLTGADLRGGMFPDPVSFEAQARFIAWRVPWDLAWAGVVVAGLGLAFLARRSRPLAVAAGLLVVSGIGFASGHRNMDLESYLLTSTFGFGMMFAAGLLRLHERLGGRVARAVAIVLVIGTAAMHWKDSDESGNRLAEAHVRDLLGPLPADAVYFTTHWDFGQSASYYFQEVEGLRRDVLVVSPQLLRFGWYYDELERRAPGLVARAQPEGRRYRDALAAVEARRSRDRARVDREYRAFLNAFTAGAMRDRAVVASGRVPELDRGWRRVPYHLVTWLRADSAYVPERPWLWAYEPWNGPVDVNVAMTSWLYGTARMARADYEAAHGDGPATRRILETIPQFDPGVSDDRIGPMPAGAGPRIQNAADFFDAVRRTLEVAHHRAARRRPQAT